MANAKSELGALASSISTAPAPVVPTSASGFEVSSQNYVEAAPAVATEYIVEDIGSGFTISTNVAVQSDVSWATGE